MGKHSNNSPNLRQICELGALAESDIYAVRCIVYDEICLLSNREHMEISGEAFSDILTESAYLIGQLSPADVDYALENINHRLVTEGELF